MRFQYYNSMNAAHGLADKLTNSHFTAQVVASKDPLPQGELREPVTLEHKLWSVNELNGITPKPKEAILSYRQGVLDAIIDSNNKPVFLDYSTYELVKLGYTRGVPLQVLIQRHTLSIAEEQLDEIAKNDGWHLTRLKFRRLRAETINEMLDDLAADVTSERAMQVLDDHQMMKGILRPTTPKEAQAMMMAQAKLDERIAGLGLNLHERKKAKEGAGSGVTINIGGQRTIDWSKAGKATIDVETLDPSSDVIRKTNATEKLIELQNGEN